MADFWVFLWLLPKPKLEDLPSEDRRLLQAPAVVNISVSNKPEKHFFTQLVFDKFLTINMSNYMSEVFLDGDLIPLLHLEYVLYIPLL